MLFQAKVLTPAQAIELRDIEAAHEEEARRVVEASGVRLLALRKMGVGLQRGGGTRSFNLAVFNQQLHSLLEAGQTVVDSIEILGDNDRKGRHRNVYDTLLGGLRQGKQLSESMALLPSVFSPLYVAMVRSSETTGTVRASVSRFMEYQRQVDEIRRKLVAAAIYPAVLLSVGFLVVSFLMLYVVPRFSAVYDDAGAGGRASGGFVQVWGTFVRDHGMMAWGGFIALAFSIVFALLHPAWRARFLKHFFETPWVGDKIRMLQLARLYRTLGMLLGSGVSVLAAMRMTKDALPPNLHVKMEEALVKVSEGRPMSSVLAEAGLSTEVAQRLMLAGESSGNLDEMMERIADFYDQEMSQWIDTAGRLIEPMLMVGIGLIIGAVVLMLYMPIFDLTNVVS